MQWPAILQVWPFGFVLASIALGPALMPRRWHRHRFGILATLCVGSVVSAALATSLSLALTQVADALVRQWMPFAAMLLALYASSGGILVTGGPWGRPLGNTLLLAIATLLAGVLGTTGAVLVAVHPLLRANSHRRHRMHLILFLTLLAGNVGGASTPLGDPPLLVGFLHGVPFSWPLRVLGPKMLLLAGILLALFLAVDTWLGRGEAAPAPSPLRLRGLGNVALAAMTVALAVVCGLAGARAILPCGLGWLLVALASWRFTPHGIRVRNRFSWEPMAEVLVIFAAIFVTVAPVLAMLRDAAGLALATNQDALSPASLFWASGLLSSILDNAPTYLVFTHLGGATPASLAAAHDPRLAAIAAGAVFFGGLTYIGNAPNLMLRAMASHAGVRMPGFFRYMLLASGAMLPGLLLIGYGFTR